MQAGKVRAARTCSLESEEFVELLELFAHLGALARVAQIVRLHETAAAAVAIELVAESLAEDVAVVFAYLGLSLAVLDEEVLANHGHLLGEVELRNLRLQQS